ncbi:LOW QUALITY PROTEIN: hypothetical protein PHMEG_00020807 [Phytophthora megakarya]|uniref:Transposase n=1 Tax=Phytophthora megakarya TaxID=4795 RepID=A0A225VPR0_9STRA|nr:LOW QUALITY PROTEIN: hypothetical protein PHMEG_00020807 [Phytophthora megakarya]
MSWIVAEIWDAIPAKVIVNDFIEADVSSQVRVAVAGFLTTLSKEGRLRYDIIAHAKRMFELKYLSSLSGAYPAALVLLRKLYSPRPTRLSAKAVGESAATVPLCQRQTLRALATASGIPRSTLHRNLKNKVLRHFISWVKPALTGDHKLQQLTCILDQVQRGSSYRRKWFNIYKASSRYYLSADKAIPYRSCSNRRYIGEVMFIAVAARPIYDFRRKTYIDGKIGIWPIVG